MNYVVYKCLMIGSMVGGVVCMAAILAYSFRGVLRRLLEKWLKLGPIGRMLSLLFFTVGILFGGSKNDVQGLGIRDWGLGLDSQTEKRNPFRLEEKEGFLSEDEADGNPLPRSLAQTTTSPASQTYQTSQTSQTFQTSPSWTARGAFCDWRRVEFPDSFAFPVGTNLVSGMTVLAWGEIRDELRCPELDLALPECVSLEPGVSVFSHGLSASNSYVFAWTDCCVDREATNRVDASIELFQNGDAIVRFGESVTNIVAALPAGYVGEGQDNDWLHAAFPNEYAAITNKGYETWLMQDHVGYNEENGNCKLTVTVHEMPPNGQPCYLVCGPYKTVVKEAGEYSFPIEVLTEYTVRTYPTDVPLSISYDEGYYPPESEYGMSMVGRSAAMARNAPSRGPTTALVLPGVYLTPSYIDFASMVNRHVRIWCNMTQAAWEYVTLGPDEAKLRFHNRHDAEVIDWASTRLARIIIYNRTHPEVYGYLDLFPPYTPEDNPTPTNDCHSGSSPTNAPPSGATP